MKLGYCYNRSHDEFFSLNVDEDILKIIMKNYEDAITEMINNGQFKETFDAYEQWKTLNDLLEESKGKEDE